MKNIKQFHHLIYAFSPDRSRMTFTKESYLYGYPGDDYVDIIGYDNYMDVGISWNKKSTRDQQKDFVSGLRLISSIANDKNKIAALTETGLETISNENWFTETLLNPIKGDTSIQVSFVVLWRNATEKHHYAPYPSHSSVSDFLLFYNDPFSLFGNDIQNLYRENKPLHKEK